MTRAQNWLPGSGPRRALALTSTAGGNHLNRLPAPDPQAEVSAAGDRG